MTTEITLPEAPFRARVKIQRPDGRIERVGRVTVSVAETRVSLEGNPGLLRDAVVAEVQILGQQAWVVRTEDGERWTIMAGGCGCGSR